jgi:hypothetical protein
MLICKTLVLLFSHSHHLFHILEIFLQIIVLQLDIFNKLILAVNFLD